MPIKRKEGNSRLKKTEDVFNYVIKTLGPEKVRDIVVRAKALERSKEREKEKERERAWKREQMSR